MFEVISGTYEEFQGEQEVSVKYIEEFTTFEEAFAAFESQKSRTWSALYMEDKLVTGFNPLD